MPDHRVAVTSPPRELGPAVRRTPAAVTIGNALSSLLPATAGPFIVTLRMR